MSPQIDYNFHPQTATLCDPPPLNIQTHPHSHVGRPGKNKEEKVYETIYKVIPNTNYATYENTLCKRLFPWNEIKFHKFSAIDCYYKYRNTITDPVKFQKKVYCAPVKKNNHYCIGVKGIIF